MDDDWGYPVNSETSFSAPPGDPQSLGQWQQCSKTSDDWEIWETAPLLFDDYLVIF